MFKIQKNLNLIEKDKGGRVFLEPSNIHKNQILDRDVIDNYVKQSTDDSTVLQECLNSFLSLANNGYDINNTMYDISLNKINAINNLLNINKNINDAFIENFEDCQNIDMSSDVFINFTNNYCSLPYISTEHIPIKSILISNDANYENKYITSIKNNFIDDIYNYDILNSKNQKAIITLEVEIEPSIINELRLSCSSINTCKFSLHCLSENKQYINVSNIETDNDPIFIFNETYTDKIKIIIEKSYDYTFNGLYNYSVILKSINILCNTFNSNATLISKPFKLYGNTNSITTMIKSNSEDIDCYIGLIDKSNNTTWYNGNLPIDTNISIESSEVLNNMNIGFYAVNNQGMHSIFELNTMINTNSIKLYSGYNKYKVVTIENAVVNDDLSYVQYSQENVVSNVFMEMDNCSVTVSSNQLSVITANFILEEDMRINIPFIKCADTNIDFISSIRINGKAVNASITENEYEVLCKKGINDISILCYIKDDSYTDTTTVTIKIPINLIAYSDFIYSSEMQQVPYYELIANKNYNNFAIGSNSIYVNTNIDKNSDQYLIQYTHITNSNKIYTDFNGNYLTCIYKLSLSTKNQHKNVFVKSIEIYSR